MEHPLQHIVQQVNEAASLDEALAIIVSRVKEITGADVCFVFLKEATTGHYVLTASEGLYPEAVKIIPTPFSPLAVAVGWITIVTVVPGRWAQACRRKMPPLAEIKPPAYSADRHE